MCEESRGIQEFKKVRLESKDELKLCNCGYIFGVTIFNLQNITKIKSDKAEKLFEKCLRYFVQYNFILKKSFEYFYNEDDNEEGIRLVNDSKATYLQHKDSEVYYHDCDLGKILIKDFNHFLKIFK